MAILIYVFLHFFSFILLDRYYRYLYVYVVAVCSVLLYVIKRDSYDIYGYVDGVQYSWVFEYGYDFLIRVLKSYVVNDDRCVILGVQVLLACLYLFPLYVMSKGRLCRSDFILTGSVIVVLSLGFTLGVNNALRQAFSAVLIVGALLYVMKGEWLGFIVCGVLAQLFHNSGIIFLGYASLIIFLSKSAFVEKISGVCKQYFVVSLMSLFALVMISLVVGFTGYASYMGRDYSLLPDRSSLLVKGGGVFLVFIVTEVLAEKKINYCGEIYVMRMLRWGVLSLVLLMGMNAELNEMGSRVLFFYFIVEMYYLVLLYENGIVFAVVIALMSYGFAPNAIHIIGS